MSVSTITPDEKAKLLESAQKAANNAYAPYSHYQVGAALLTADGNIYLGANVENAAYPATICAERSAAVSAIAQGSRDFKAMVLVTANGGTPCGICRQFLSEFNLDLPLFIYKTDGTPVSETTVRNLLPESFGSSHLPKTVE